MRFRLALAALLPAAALLCGTALPAAAQQKLKFSVNFTFDGSNAAFVLAEQAGYFKAEGIDVTVDANPAGTGEAVARVAAGTYDMSFADINYVIDFNNRTPDHPVMGVYMVYGRPPLTIVSMKKSGITKPDDLKGKLIGAPANDGAFKMLPVFAKAANLDLSALRTQNMDMRLREAMLIKGDVDAVTGFDSSVWFNMKAQGVKFEDVSMMYYADFGLDLYGNSVMVTPTFAQKNPELVKAALRAINKGYKAIIANPKAGVDALLKRDSLLKPDIEQERIEWLNKNQIVTSEAKELGLGAVNPERFKRSIAAIAGGFNIPAPAPEKIFSDAYLPPLADRKL